MKLPKPLPYHSMLNQPPRSPNGKHRRPGKTAHGNSINGTGAIKRPGTTYITTTLPPAQWTTINAGSKHGASPLTAIDWAATADAMRQMALYGIGYYEVDDLETKAEPEPIPTSIHSGEIISHKIWLINRNQLLCSLIENYPYYPNKPMIGDVDKKVAKYFDPYNASMKVIYGGVFSYKSEEYMKSEYDFTDFRSSDPKIIGCAYGMVKSWGQVIEHEHGYRAEFAKPHSIASVHLKDQHINPAKFLYNLRRRYSL